MRLPVAIGIGFVALLGALLLSDALGLRVNLAPLDAGRALSARPLRGRGG